MAFVALFDAFHSEEEQDDIKAIMESMSRVSHTKHFSSVTVPISFFKNEQIAVGAHSSASSMTKAFLHDTLSACVSSAPSLSELSLCLCSHP